MCTLVSPWLQHSEKEIAKQLLNLNISKIIKNALKKTEALNITLLLWEIKKRIKHKALYFYYLSG